MKHIKLSLTSMMLLFSSAVLVSSCQKDTPPAAAPVEPAAPKFSFTENFESLEAVTSSGWVTYNRSEPIGGEGWRSGVYQFSGKYGGDVRGFHAYNSVAYPQEYAAAQVTCVNDLGSISAWLITPQTQVKNGDKFIFLTKSLQGVPDRMQVRANFVDGSTDIGTGVEGVGKFTTLLADINSTLATTGYPANWTRYTFTISGLSATPRAGRFAFRYYLPTNAGNSGANADLIGVDSVAFVSN
jgi:hypothetical protein